MAIQALRIGIEIEVLLRAKRNQDHYKSSLWEFAEALIEYYNSKPKDTPGRLVLSEAGLRDWSIVEDGSISRGEDLQKNAKDQSLPPPPWGIEFVSPTMRYELGSSWRRDLSAHFHIVESYAAIMTHFTCGTHVHVSPGGSKWTLNQVKNVSRSVLYFEEAFELLLPPNRRENPTCRSNRIDNPKLRHLPDLHTCCAKIHACTTIEDLVLLMNAKEGAIPFWCDGREITLPERCYGFNFNNLLDKGLGTIEFRKPPGVTNYEDCVMWAEFGASFMLAAMQYGITLKHLRTYKSDVAGLAAFIDMAVIPDVQNQDILKRMYARGSGSLPVVPLPVPSSD